MYEVESTRFRRGGEGRGNNLEMEIPATWAQASVLASESNQFRLQLQNERVVRPGGGGVRISKEKWGKGEMGAGLTAEHDRLSQVKQLVFWATCLKKRLKTLSEVCNETNVRAK